MTKMTKIATALLAPIILTGCLLLPGKFESALTLQKDGGYSFTYNGQMQIFSGDEKGGPGSRQSYAPFDPESAKCSSKINNETGEVTELDYEYYGGYENSDPTSPFRYEERECSEEEVAAKRKEHDDSLARRKKRDDEQRAAMGAIFGGAVPGDDESLKAFARQLEKYDGWNKVDYVGENMFEVEYAISGRFDQNFAFPTLPGATMQFPFLQIIRRNGGELEILTPAMGGPGGLFGAMMAKEMGGARNAPEIRPIEGSFVIRTDGDVLSNNSADGYASEEGMKVIRWVLDESSALDASPRAIIKLDR